MISEFKGKPLISVREYYTDAAGDMKPGKKVHVRPHLAVLAHIYPGELTPRKQGISLTLDQWNSLMKATTEVNAELSAKGHAVTDPSAGNAPAASTSTTKPSKESDKQKKSKRANIEATSDEEDDEDEE